jgi:uncharacterized SAM-binding protein YcdF (DUF218 family)
MEDTFYQSRDAITSFLFIEDPPERVDFCFVMGSPSITTIFPAIDLYHQGFAPKLVISGRGPGIEAEPEWLAYSNMAIKHAVPPSAIHVEKEARNTLENFVFSSHVIATEIGWNNVTSVAIAAKPFHMRRVQMTARRHWPGHIRLIMRPSYAEDEPSALDWWKTESGRRFVFGELRAIGNYALMDKIGGV